MTSSEKLQRIAYCECGARLAGRSQQELFDAAQQHIACQHPNLLADRSGGCITLATPRAHVVGGHDQRGH